MQQAKQQQTNQGYLTTIARVYSFIRGKYLRSVKINKLEKFRKFIFEEK